MADSIIIVEQMIQVAIKCNQGVKEIRDYHRKFRNLQRTGMSDNSDIPTEGLRVKSRVYLYFVVVMTPWLNPCYVRSLQCNQNTYYKS